MMGNEQELQARIREALATIINDEVKKIQSKPDFKNLPEEAIRSNVIGQVGAGCRVVLTEQGRMKASAA